MDPWKRSIDTEEGGIRDSAATGESDGGEIKPPTVANLQDNPVFLRLLELFRNLPEDRQEALLRELENEAETEVDDDNEDA